MNIFNAEYSPPFKGAVAPWSDRIARLSANPIIQTDPEGRTTWVNAAFETLTGYSAAEATGRTPGSLLQCPQTDPAVVEAIRAALKARSPIKTEILNRSKAGRDYWLMLEIQPAFDAQGELEGFLSIQTDITEIMEADARKREALEAASVALAGRAALMEALSERTLAAEVASAAKGQFLANMSHELRTPMHGVLGMLDLLLKTPLNPEQSVLASSALGSARNLLVILNDILDFSKIEHGLVAIEHAPYQPAALIQDLRPLLAELAEDKNILLTWSLSPNVPEWVSGDPSRIRQVLTKLIGNGIKFTGQGEVAVNVSYKASQSGGELTFKVRDSGIGLSADAQAHIFDHFVQADSSTTRRFGGAGLGLAISRQLAQLMGGDIHVRSREGVGSTFALTVTAPLAQSPVAEEHEVVEDPTLARPLRILAADDHEVNRMLVQMYLQIAGHDVTVVEDGAQALMAMKEQDFDLVLMDIQMPVMDGLAATRQIRALPYPQCDVPVIAVTANAMTGDREKYLAEGMNDYVAKPIDQATLLAVVARVSAVIGQASAA